MQQPAPVDESLIALLNERNSLPTEVVLADGRRLHVRNIAWAYDMGDEFAHITTNCSPFVDRLPIDFFFTSEVEAVIDEHGHDLYRS